MWDKDCKKLGKVHWFLPETHTPGPGQQLGEIADQLRDCLQVLVEPSSHPETCELSGLWHGVDELGLSPVPIVHPVSHCDDGRVRGLIDWLERGMCCE
jgi:hypothetical protein